MSWNDGYVTDVSYTTGYYRQQSPDHLAASCLLGSVAPGFIARDRLTYLELGCGRGRGAMCLAASNPDWRVIAIDFMPAHVAEAREIAAAAGLSNVEFAEADLATLDPRSLPEVDVVSAHGLWSWVSDAVRAGIVRLLAERLRPGGALHLSYNALPGWQQSFGLQRLLRVTADRLPGRSDRKAKGALELVRALASAEAEHLGNPFVKGLLGGLDDVPPEYLAHEFLNDSWRPCFHGDVAQALSAAKLDYAASASLAENFPQLVMTEAQRAICDGLDDPAQQELVKDVCMGRAFRHDVYVRGAVKISDAQRDAALRSISLMLTVAAENFAYQAKVPAGEATLEPSFYRPVVAALAARPRRIHELLAAASPDGRRGNPAELLAMLIGSGQAVIVAHPERDACGADLRLNEELAARRLRGETMRGGALASARLGAGLPCDSNDLVVLSLLRRFGAEAPARLWAAELSSSLQGEAREDLLTAAEQVKRLRTSVWQQAGLLDEANLHRLAS